MVGQLLDAGFEVLKELVIPTMVRVRVPDIIASGEDLDSWVLDVQVVTDLTARDRVLQRPRHQAVGPGKDRLCSCDFDHHHQLERSCRPRHKQCQEHTSAEED